MTAHTILCPHCSLRVAITDSISLERASAHNPTPAEVESSCIAWWEAIPFHCPWEEYDNAAGKEGLRKYMRLALVAYEAEKGMVK